MKKIAELEKIVVLIDADNAQLSKLKAILDEVSTHGRIVVKKAYGNWKNPILKNWEAELKKLAIKPEQQFAYTIGKNATDISMVIGAMDLLYTGLYDAFVLVCSDSDYTPLAIRLRESGVYVFGAGEDKTPVSFRNACDEFILTQYLMTAPEETAAEPEAESKVPAKKDGERIATASKSKEKSQDRAAAVRHSKEMREVHMALRRASDKYQDPEGWVNVSSAGSYMKRIMPDFNPQKYGFTKLPDLIKAFPKKYELNKYKGLGTVWIVAYRCLDNK